MRAAIPRARIQEHYGILLDGFAVELPATSLARLMGLPAVNRVYPSFTYTRTMDRGPSVIHATDLQAATGDKGQGMKIGVVDTGVDASNPFLAPAGFSYPPGFPRGDKRHTTAKVIVARVFPGPVRDRLSNQAFDPTEPHGTHVAGIAAGDEGTNAPAGPDHPATANLSGVAPRAWIGNYRVFTIPTPFGHEADTPEIVSAFEAAVADGMNVINFSGGGPETDPANDAMNEAVHNTALAGVVPVIASGNDRDDYGLGSAGSPGTAPDAISVAAVSNAHVFAPALSVVGGPPSLGAVPIQIPAAPETWANSDQTLIDVATIVGTDGKPVRPVPLRPRRRPEQRPRQSSERLTRRQDRAGLARPLQLRLEGGTGAARRRGRHRARRQPTRRGEPDSNPVADPGGNDRRPRRAGAARIRRRERRQGANPRLERDPGAADEPRRRDHELLVGRPDRLRAPAEAGHLCARPRRVVVHPACDHRLDVLRLRRHVDGDSTRRRRGCPVAAATSRAGRPGRSSRR